MTKIIGNTTATPNPRPDWLQTDETKADYIKNKPLENGEGKNSLQLNKNSDEFKQKDSADYPSYKSGAFGIGSISLSNNGKVDRNHFLDIGNLNVAEYSEKETPYEEQDDGGALIGYKHYTNSRGVTLLGAWGRAIDAKCALVSGYTNTTKHTASGNSASLNIGSNNYLFGNTKDTVLVGTCLLNDKELTSQAHFGMYNKPGKDVIYSIGNGTAGGKYIKLDTKPTLDEAIAHSIEQQYSPNTEFKWYLKKVENSNKHADHILITPDTTQEDYDKYSVAEYRFEGRSNAFQVTVDGRAQLIQKEVNGALIEKDDNDILIKKEVENIISLDNLDSTFFDSLYFEQSSEKN